VASAEVPPTAPPVVCLPTTTAEAEIFSSTLEGNRLTLCMRAGAEGARGFACGAVDLETRTLLPASTIPAATTSPEAPPGPASPWKLTLRRKTFEPLGDPSLLVQVRPGVWLLGRGDAYGYWGEATNQAIELTFLHLDSGKRTVLPLPARPNLEPQGHELDAHPWRGPLWGLAHSTPPGVVWLDTEKEALIHQLPIPLCR
jgi:hypothetical protein